MGIPDKENMNPFWLLFLWSIQVALVIIVAILNPNHYTTFDSGYYLASARFLMDGQGYLIQDGSVTVWNSVFPMGYSLLIALVALGTGIKVLWASKIVNLLFSGLWLFYLNKWFGTKTALLTGSILLFGNFLKIWVHTWSEPSFLILLFFLLYHFQKMDSQPNLKRGLTVLLLGIALMLIRYAGIFIIFLTLLVGFSSLYKRRFVLAKINFGLALGWTSFIALYFLINNLLGNSWYGGERFYGLNEFSTTFILFIKALINEILVFRNTDFMHLDAIFVFGLFAQSIVLFLAFKKMNFKPSFIHFKKDSITQYTFIFALMYLLFLVIIRLLSPFDEPGYRLMSPFSFLFLWILLYSFSSQRIVLKPVYLLYFGIFIVLTWLELAPEKNINEKLTPLFQLF